MESSQEKTKTLPIFKEIKQDTKREGDDIDTSNDLQNFFDKLSKNEQLVIKLKTLMEIKNSAEIKSIDLIKSLRGTQYSTTIELFFDFGLAFNKLKECFEKLRCSHPDCESQVAMAFEGKDGEPTIQYCNDHFNHSNNSTEFPKIFDFELKFHKILFDELEIQLVYIQDRINFIKSDINQKNITSYTNIEKEVQRNLNDIKRILKTMNEKIYQIDETFQTKTINKASIISFKDFSFVRNDLAKCRECILTILSQFSGPLLINQAAFLIKVMTDFKKKINLEEEKKDNPDSSVPQEIYNSEYQMVNFPSQSLKSIKDFEQKISKFYEYMETYQKNVREIVENYNPNLHQQLDQLIKKNYKNCVEQLSLCDAQFYIDKLELKPKDAESFKNNFTKSSKKYNKLEQFDYGQLLSTSHHFHTCIGETYGDDWIYIGDVKKGTNDIPHGIGIKVWSTGHIHEGYWKDGKQHGRGRAIWSDGGYYIGEWERDSKSGEGTFYYKDGDRYEGGWKDGCKYGQGTYYDTNGDKFTGLWDDYCKGQGEIIFTDGKKYTGHWDDFQRHGLGTLYSSDGQALNKGKWEKNEYVGKE